MTPVLLCEYIVAGALGLAGAVFILACLAALIKWLFIKPDPDDDGDEDDDGEERPADFKATSKAAAMAASKDTN